MRSYFIFAIVLTVAYLIYYAVIIMQDLYGKRRTGKTEEEVFDLGTLEDVYKRQAIALGIRGTLTTSPDLPLVLMGIYSRTPSIMFLGVKVTRSL